MKDWIMLLMVKFVNIQRNMQVFTETKVDCPRR